MGSMMAAWWRNRWRMGIGSGIIAPLPSPQWCPEPWNRPGEVVARPGEGKGKTGSHGQAGPFFCLAMARACRKGALWILGNGKHFGSGLG